MHAGIGFLSPAQSDDMVASTGSGPDADAIALRATRFPLDIVSRYIRVDQWNGGPTVVNLMARLGGRGRHHGANAIVHLAREVVGRRRTIQNATQEARNAVILDSLADEDFRALDTTISERTVSDREFAQTLARLTYAAARAKGFDRCVVDAALRLDSLVPVDDPAHERDKLLRDAYASAQKASYIRGGRLALGRLGRRAVEVGDLERARVLLHQQLDLGPEKDDTAAEVDSALVLGDILRRENDDDQAQTFYRRAGAAAERLEYRQGVAEALVRQIDTTPSANLETVAALQHQALDAAQRTGDSRLEARILVGLADTLVESGRLDEATPYYRNALTIAQDEADLALEARCVTALAHAHRDLGHTLDAVEMERAALGIEERLGNRQAAANWALSLGMSELRLRNAESAIEAFERARLLGNQIGDVAIEQRAEGSLGIAHTLLGRGSETIDHLSRAIELARRSQDQAQEAQWVSSLGQAYAMFGQTDDAIRVTHDAISLAEATHNVAMQAESFTMLGQIYAGQRETIRARDCYTRALQLNRDLGQTADQVTTLTALARLAADTGQFTQASQLFDQALQLSLSTGDRQTTTVLYGRMGNLAQKRGDLRAALANYQRAVESAQSLGDAQLITRALQYLATAQDVMGDPQAVTSYERAVTAADDAGDIRGGITMRLNMGMLIGRMPEQGAAEDAIGWLSDAANYAMEAGAEFNELRHQAEDLLQELGGGSNRHIAAEGRSRSDQSGRAPFDDDRDDERHQPGYADGQDRQREFSGYDRSGSDYDRDDDRYAAGYRSDDERAANEPYDVDPYDLDQRDRDPYERDPRRRDEPVAAAGGYADEYDDYDDQDFATPEDRDPYYEPDDRERFRYAEPGRDDARFRSDGRRFDRDPYRDDHLDDHRSGARYDDPNDGDRYASDRSREDVRYPERSRRQDSRYADRYDDRRPGQYQDTDEDRYLTAEPARWSRDRDVDPSMDDDDRYGAQRFSDEDVRYRDGSNGRGGDHRSRRQPTAGLTGVNGSSDAGFSNDRYGDDPDRGYDGYQDNGAEYDPNQRSGRNDRAGRREAGRRGSLNRGVEDEPSDPGPTRAAGRWRSGLAGRLSRSPRESDASHYQNRDLIGAPGRRSEVPRSFGWEDHDDSGNSLDR